MLVTPAQGKLGRVMLLLKKMKVNGPGEYKLARKKSLAVGVACMAIHGPARLLRENL